MESKDGQKAGDAPKCLKDTEQPFPGQEAGVTETTAAWSAGRLRVFCSADFTCPFLFSVYGTKPVPRCFLGVHRHLLPIPVRTMDLMVLLAELQKKVIIPAQ